MRILSFPFIAIIHLIWAILVYLKTMYWLARYGGESVIYNKKVNRDSILSIYNRLEEIVNHEPKEQIIHD